MLVFNNVECGKPSLLILFKTNKTVISKGVWSSDDSLILCRLEDNDVYIIDGDTIHKLFEDINTSKEIMSDTED